MTRACSRQRRFEFTYRLLSTREHWWRLQGRSRQTACSVKPVLHSLSCPPPRSVFMSLLLNPKAGSYNDCKPDAES